MTLGHNRPPSMAKQPGTNLAASGLPVARIYQPPRSVMQSGPGRQDWILEFEPYRPLKADPYTGWTSSDDPYRHISLSFPDRESAEAFAERQGWAYEVRLPPPERRDRNRLYRGVEAEGSFPIRWPGEAGGVQRHRLFTGAQDLRKNTENDEFDPVTEASMESFPASDPPAFTGTTSA